MITDSVELQLGLALVIGYLCGSVPFGVILTRIAGAGDLRAIGSGNIGATNVLRTGRKGLAAATLLGDLLKGTVAVLIAKSYLGPDAALLAAVAAFLGHLFPVWLNFKGGKGVATFLAGALVAGCIGVRDCLVGNGPVIPLFFSLGAYCERHLPHDRRVFGRSSYQ